MNSLINIKEFEVLRPYLVQVRSDGYVNFKLPLNFEFDTDKVNSYLNNAEATFASDQNYINLKGFVKDIKLFELIQSWMFTISYEL